MATRVPGEGDRSGPRTFFTALAFSLLLSERRSESCTGPSRPRRLGCGLGLASSLVPSAGGGGKQPEGVAGGALVRAGLVTAGLFRLLFF